MCSKHNKLIHVNCGGRIMITLENISGIETFFCYCDKCDTTWNINYLDEMIDIEVVEDNHDRPE